MSNHTQAFIHNHALPQGTVFDAQCPRCVLDRAAPELLEALEDAIRLVRFWHGMGMTKDLEVRMWLTYQESPEMKRLNAALAKARGRT